MDNLVIWSVAISAILGGLALVWRTVRRIARLIEEFGEDWRGTPPRPGVPGRRGVMERLDRIEHELHPNSGSSLRDAVDRVEQSVRGSDLP
ncbi:hypothetical protein [Streptomyces sp. CB03911]|uniref:hypothetical protein n=1 Tax=Streptomyces sp. CB03911 TaxID=1804758 RepID=UPI0018FE82AA|nr:hypothetical protein [Streptomyces sp. CB03911]